LSSRAATFEFARAAMERARKAMISQRKASANAHVYSIGDQVRISTRVLKPCQSTGSKAKLQQLYIGPFKVTRLLGPKTLSVHLPQTYSVNNAFNFEDVRPWFDHAAHALDPAYPAVQSQPALNPIIAVVNRRRLCGRLPAGVELLDIPCEYQVLRRDGTVEWLPSSASQLLDDESVRHIVVKFELRYPRDTLRPCNFVKDYPEDEGYESPDEYPIALHEQLFDRMK
jgi:hypothetical protein